MLLRICKLGYSQASYGEIYRQFEYIVNSDQVGDIKVSDTKPKLLLTSVEAAEKYIQSINKRLTSIIELFLSRISPYYSRVKKTTPADLNLGGDFAKLEKAGWIMTAAYYTNWVKYSKVVQQHTMLG